MTDFQGKPGNTREANQVIIENVRQQPSGFVQLRPEYAFSVERRCELTQKFHTQKGIRCESRKSATTLCAYGGKEPLRTLGTFSGNVFAFDRTHTIYVRDDDCLFVGAQPKDTQILLMKHQNTSKALF